MAKAAGPTRQRKRSDDQRSDKHERVSRDGPGILIGPKRLHPQIARIHESAQGKSRHAARSPRGGGALAGESRIPVPDLPQPFPPPVVSERARHKQPRGFNEPTAERRDGADLVLPHRLIPLTGPPPRNVSPPLPKPPALP